MSSLLTLSQVHATEAIVNKEDPLAATITMLTSEKEGVYTINDGVFFVVVIDPKSVDQDLHGSAIRTALGEMVFAHLTVIEQDLSQIIVPQLSEDLLSALSHAMRLDRESYVHLKTPLVWQSKDRGRSIYRADVTDVKSIVEEFPKLTNEYIRSTYLRYLASKETGESQVKYHAEVGSVVDTFRAVKSFVNEALKDTELAFPYLSSDPVVVTATVRALLDSGRLDPEREIKQTEKLSSHELGYAHALWELSKFVGRADYLNQAVLDKMIAGSDDPKLQAFLKASKRVVSRSYSDDWLDFVDATGGHVFIYALRTGGALMLDQEFSDGLGKSTSNQALTFSSASVGNEDPLQSIEKSLRTLSSHPRNSAVWRHLSSTLNRVGYMDEAIACLRMALILEPDNLYVRRELAEAYGSRGHVELGKIVLASVHDWKGRGGEGSKDPDFLASLPSILEIGH